jgi:hypothetical protein
VNPQTKLQRLFLTLTIVACISIIGFLVGLPLTQHQTPPPPAQVIVMRKPYLIPTPKVGLLDKVMPLGPSWGFLWKLRYALFGKTRIIDLNSEFIDVTGLELSVVVPPGKPDVTMEDGLRIWRVNEADLKGLRQLLKQKPEQVLALPRITTGSECKCSIFCGGSVATTGQQVGVSADVLPFIKKEMVDLTAVFCCSEAITNLAGAVSIRTNFDFGGRFQLSQDVAGVFVLAAPGRSADEKRIALLLTSKLQRPNK